MFLFKKKTDKQKFEEKQLKKGQYCFCYCDCGNELISSNSCIKDTDYVYFKCSKCGQESKWDFDTPCPIVIKEIKKREEEIISKIKEIGEIKCLESTGTPSYCIEDSHIEAIQGLLDLYQKEKEKNEELNRSIELFIDGYSKIAKELKIKSYALNENIVINHIKENYISKDKIRDKIKELEDEGTTQYWTEKVQDMLKELLGE